MRNRKAEHSAQELHTEALEGQFGLLIAGQLHRAAEAVPHDIGERLRIARELALTRARLVRQTATAPAVAVSGRGAAVLAGPPSVWIRLASLLPLLVLVGGLVLIQRHHLAEQIHAAAEIDTALLADELPPTAYGDPGFSEFLRDAAKP